MERQTQCLQGRMPRGDRGSMWIAWRGPLRQGRCGRTTLDGTRSVSEGAADHPSIPVGSPCSTRIRSSGADRDRLRRNALPHRLGGSQAGLHSPAASRRPPPLLVHGGSHVTTTQLSAPSRGPATDVRGTRGSARVDLRGRLMGSINQPFEWPRGTLATTVGTIQPALRGSAPSRSSPSQARHRPQRAESDASLPTSGQLVSLMLG